LSGPTEYGSYFNQPYRTAERHYALAHAPSYRLTYAFSKKLENFEAAVALHFAYYNFVRTHGSLKMTPAMMAGIEKSFWSVGDLVEAAS
jgi:hypothetical protein